VKQIPKNLQDHYDKVRAEKQEMVQRHYKEMKNGRKAEKDKGPGKREQKRQEYITEYGDDVLKLVMEGTPRNSIATALGIPANQVTQIAKSFGYSYLNRQWRGV
jgi:FixJ family two-component response regulator